MAPVIGKSGLTDYEHRGINVANGRLTDGEIRELIVAEVTKHTQPLKDWMYAFWSNGDKSRPPGFFQSRIAADDLRFAHLQDETNKQTEILDKVDEFIKLSNARQFESEERQKRKEKRIAFWLPIAKWVLGGIGTALLAFIIWAAHAVVPVVKVLWEDYLKAHPVAQQRIKNLSYSTEPVVSYSQKPSQDASAPLY
jgi:hypothetical protein